jgi:hypothetical protein
MQVHKVVRATSTTPQFGELRTSVLPLSPIVSSVGERNTGQESPLRLSGRIFRADCDGTFRRILPPCLRSSASSGTALEGCIRRRTASLDIRPLAALLENRLARPPYSVAENRLAPARSAAPNRALAKKFFQSLFRSRTGWGSMDACSFPDIPVRGPFKRIRMAFISASSRLGGTALRKVPTATRRSSTAKGIETNTFRGPSS